MAIYHAYTQTVADGTATSVVRPSDWNSGHVQGFFLAGNTSNASTVTGTDVYFSGGNGVTLSGSNNSIGISVGTGFNVSVSNTSSQLTQLAFPNSNGITWGLTNGSITANIPMLISAANGTASPATLSFQDGGGVSWSTNANGIQASVAGGGGPTLSYFEPPVRGVSSSTQPANAASYVQSVPVGNYVSAYQLNIAHQCSSLTSTFSISGSVSAGNATSFSASAGGTYNVSLMSRVSTGTNANSSIIISHASGSMSTSAGFSGSVSWSTNASSATVSVTTSIAMGWLQNINSTGGTTTSAFTASGSTSFSSTSTNANSFSSSFGFNSISGMNSGIRMLAIPLVTSMSPGEYWLALNRVTNSGTTNQNASQMIIAATGLVMYSTLGGMWNLGNTATQSTTAAAQFVGTYTNPFTSTIASTQASANSGVINNFWFNMMAATK